MEPGRQTGRLPTRFNGQGLAVELFPEAGEPPKLCVIICLTANVYARALLAFFVPYSPASPRAAILSYWDDHISGPKRIMKMRRRSLSRRR
jgi:hypothetical protein